MHVTLRDVCRHTGVSTATVSRVLNGSPLVTEGTRERVMKVIDKLGYQPSHAARTLKSNRTEMLAVVFPEIHSGFFAEVLRGLDAMASEYNHHLLTVFSHGQADEQALITRVVKERRADAVILMNVTLPDAFIERLATWEMPLVLIDRPVRKGKLISVSIDNRAGSEAIAEHVLELGYKRIAYITGPKNSYDSIERFKAFRQALKKGGVALDPKLVWTGGFTEYSGQEMMQKWMLGGGVLPEIVVAGNDAMALGVLSVLRARGLDVPRDMALIGFDDTDMARYLGLTTVHVPMRNMGRLAAQAAIDLLAKKKVRNEVLPTHLVVRQSSRRAGDSQ